MAFGFREIALLVLAGVLLAGCETGRAVMRREEPAPRPSSVVSINQLAERLGLEVVDTSSSFATLRNAGNRVFIIADPGGRATVNGTPVGPRSGYKVAGGVMYVPEEALRAIRAAMVHPAPEPYEPAVFKPWPTPATYHRCVVIDPGHGGKDPGATSVLGYQEKALNLAVALEVAQLLRDRGMQVKLTRESDRFIELEDRAAVATAYGADLFVSLHADSAPRGAATGFSVYVRRSAPASSRSAADIIEKALARSNLPRRGVMEADFRVLTHSRCPAVLVEMGYLSNYRDAAFLADRGFQHSFSRNLADGICDFLGLNLQSAQG